MHTLIRLTAQVGLIVSVTVVILIAGCGQDAPPTTRSLRPTYFIWITIPRLPNNNESYADVVRVLKELPSFAKPTRDSKTNSLINANTNRISDGPMNIQFHFSPTTTSDLGDVAKALATLNGDKTKPAATVNLAAATPIDEKRFAQLKSELSTAKGIDWENSSRSALALDETGGANFEVIRAAYKKAGITLSDAYTDK